MKYWVIALIACLTIGWWTGLSEETPPAAPSKNSHIVEAKLEPKPGTKVAATRSAVCPEITLADKHALDDWALQLQQQGLTSQWQAEVIKLPHCLQPLAQHYLAYRQALINVDDTLNLAERFELLMSLQQQFFSAEVVAAWFAKENTWHQETLTRWQILADKSLSEPQKTQLLAAHISQLNEVNRDVIAKQQQFQQLSKEWQTMSYNELADNIGAAAANRVIKAQQQQQQWQDRVQAFINDKAQIQAQYGDTAKAKRAIARLKQNNFSRTERKRLAVLVP